jgi:acyl carrier protein phosphodiesterase
MVENQDKTQHEKAGGVLKNIFSKLALKSNNKCTMNFLAHLYLSGESEAIKTGNFIGDYVKGRKFENYSGDIRKGILLHRSIDNFTDNHHLFREARKYFYPDYGRYSGIVGDVVFDHLLAKQWNQFSGYQLRDFARNAHSILLSNYLKLPFRVQQFLPIMIKHKRLESYASVEGLEKALRIMANYTTLPALSQQAVEVLEKNFDPINELFIRFMEEIICFVVTEHNITIFKPVQEIKT